VNLRRGWELNLSDGAVAEFLGGPPERVPDHYREASPAELNIDVKQLLVHGTQDDIVPVQFSRDYVTRKQQKKESASLLELAHAGHFEIVDPESTAWTKIQKAILELA
jgi:pimeloyl-ACP methyl ester carboxylesterase